MFQQGKIEKSVLWHGPLVRQGTELLPPLITLIPIMLLHVILIIIGFQYSRIVGLDFKVYYEAALCWDIGCNPWKLKLALLQNNSSILPFLYPPPFFILFRPFLFFSVTSAYGIWLFLMELMLLPIYALLVLSVRDAGIPLSDRNKSIVFAMLLLSGPTIEALLVGQVQILIALLLLIYWYSLCHKYSGLAGVSLAAACIFKPFLAVCIICALWFRLWPVIPFFILALLFVILISASASIGTKEYIEYFAAMNDFSVVLSQLSRFDLSPSRFFFRTSDIFDPNFALFLMAFSFVIVLFYKLTLSVLACSFIVIPIDSTKNRMLACGIFCLLLPLCSPVIWGHYFILSLFAYIVVIIGILDCSMPDSDVLRFRIVQSLKILCVIIPLGNFYSCVYPIFCERDIMAMFCLLYWPCIIITTIASAIHYIPGMIWKKRKSDCSGWLRYSRKMSERFYD